MRIRILSCVLLVVALCAVSVGAAESSTPAGKVNLNTASAEQLQLLPRVGPALAGRIIEFREANGPFKSPEELAVVKGIGDKSLINLTPYVVVEGKTTLTEKVKLPRASRSSEKAS